MNFATMLQATVTPLTEHKPESRRQPSRTNEADPINQEDALAKYRAAWRGEEWVKTTTIESRLGYAASSARNTLKRWEKQGLVESRKVLGENGKHKRSLGIEWRWK